MGVRVEVAGGKEGRILGGRGREGNRFVSVSEGF